MAAVGIASKSPSKVKKFLLISISLPTLKWGFNTYQN